MSYAGTVLAKSPQAYWRLNETSGLIAHDSSGNGNDATLVGSFAYSQTGAIAGDTDTAILFSSGAQLVLPPALNISTWTKLTLVLWIKTDSGFQQVAVAADNSAATITTYLNGEPVTAGSVGTVLIDENIAYAGAAGAATYDEIALYSYILSPSQIYTDYSIGVAQSFPYAYGAFQIANHSGGLGYFLVAKDLDFPTYKPTLSPIARYDGWKINGWQVDARTIQVDIVVLGSSRDDCIARKDALEQALSLRDQPLVLHSDGRYWIANPTAGKVKFSAGTGIVQARIPVTFVCADPYAKAVNAASYDTGSLAYSASGNSYVSPTFTVAAGGTVYAWPQIHLVNKSPSLGTTTLTTGLTQGQSQNAILVVNTTFSAVAGQVLTLYSNTGTQLWTQKVVVASDFATNTVQINVNTFTAAFSFPVGASVYVSTAWNQVTVSQLTDNYILAVTSTAAAPLPQTLNDTLDIYTDPSNGMYITTNGLSQYLDFTGAFPPLEPGNTQWQVSIAADSQPTVDVVWAWTARWLS